MVPSKLIGHLKTKHSTYSGKNKDFFQRILSQNKKQKHFMKSTFTVSEKAVEASYHVAKLIARQKPHNFGEELMKPACLEVVGLMLGQKEAEEVRKVSLSAETIKRRIGHMSEDLLETLLNKLKTFGKFSLQIDETTDIKKQAQLLAVVRFVDDNAIAEEYLFCIELPERTTGQDIFRVTNEFFTANGIYWSDCINLCTDGASAMLGKGKGFATLAKQQNPAIQVTHCCIHREALMTKVLPEEPSKAIKTCIDIVNFIKGRASNSRIFWHYAKKWVQSISHYCTIRLYVGFLGETFSQDSLNLGMK
uniref:protein ZBED8-like n=1 Tax=Styela clava TaxID=7725 RepID=UPI00193AD2E6|nr:protein ZBED8-like [Styela clava]